MKKRFHIEPFTPGLKARLDPTFRLKPPSGRLPEAEEILREINRDSPLPLLPFTSANKTSRITGRVFGIRDFSGNS